MYRKKRGHSLSECPRSYLLAKAKVLTMRISGAFFSFSEMPMSLFTFFQFPRFCFIFCHKWTQANVDALYVTWQERLACTFLLCYTIVNAVQKR